LKLAHLFLLQGEWLLPFSFHLASSYSSLGYWVAGGQGDLLLALGWAG
jgi:hypothetical protein